MTHVTLSLMQVKGKDQNALQNDSDSDESTSSTFDHVAVYRQMLELMQPGETVAKALRRLGELYILFFFLLYGTTFLEEH